LPLGRPEQPVPFNRVGDWFALDVETVLVDEGAIGVGEEAFGV